MTQFTFAKVPLWDDLAFYIDGNSKITWDNGTYQDPKPNAFSLPHIATCPGSTERCRTSCYVHGLKKAAPDVYRHYELNELALHAALMTYKRRWDSATTLANWISIHASGGFRWHVSGDVTGPQHAKWIRAVCNLASPIPFWIYTRTIHPSVIQQLTSANNLAVNVSVDRHNYQNAKEIARFFGTRLCYLVSEPDEEIPPLPPGSVIFPDYPLRGRELAEPTSAPWWLSLTQDQRRQVCPADFFGQSEQHRCGPCTKCLYPKAEQTQPGLRI